MPYSKEFEKNVLNFRKKKMQSGEDEGSLRTWKCFWTFRLVRTSHENFVGQILSNYPYQILLATQIQ